VVEDAALETTRGMNPPPSLASPFLKLLRAQEHLERVDELSEPFVAAESGRIRTRYDGDAGVVLFELDPQPTPPEWGPIIGDCLFNCRSSLDQFANQLAGGDPNDRDTAFPVCLDPATFEKRAARELAKMSPDAVALIEDAQPYQSPRTSHPEYDELWVLNKLCNMDKHRALHLTSLAFDGASHYGELQIAGLNFGVMAATIGTVPLAAVKVSSPDEKPPLTFHLEIAFADVLRWKMAVGVNRFLEETIEVIRLIFASAVQRGLAAVP
jgi:hypothetical protein